MRKKELRAIFTFKNTTSAMAMEKLCKEKGMDGRLIPVPTCITAGCGLSWRANLQAKEELIRVMEKYHICYDQIYELEV